MRRLIVMFFPVLFLVLVSDYGVSADSGVGTDSVFSPTQIHVTWQHDPSTTATVTWKTGMNTLFHVVKYGTEPGEYPRSAEGTYHWSPNQLSGIIHDVELTDLQPGVTYYYKCGDGLFVWSEECTFTTAPVDDRGFSFTVAGDDGVSPAAYTVASYHAEENALFHVHTGDLACADGFEPKWDWWFQQSQPYMTERPILPCIGNHEVEDLDAPKDAPFDLMARGFANATGFGRTSYLGRFALPGNEQWYSVNYGPIHFTILDSDEDFSPGSAQYEWLESDLAAASSDPEITWKICVFHRPPYSANAEHGSSTSAREYLCPLFDEFGVDLVFNGHDHNYERTYPIYGDAVTTTEKYYYENPSGTIYTVAGGGGRWLYRNGYDYWTAYSVTKHSYVIVDLINRNEMHLTAVSATYCPVEYLLTGMEGHEEVLDEYWIVKTDDSKSGYKHPRPYDAPDAYSAHSGISPLMKPNVKNKLDILRRLRDEVLYKGRLGTEFTTGYYAYTAEIINILKNDPELSSRIMTLIDSSLPDLAGALELRGSVTTEKSALFPVDECLGVINLMEDKKLSPGLSGILSELESTIKKAKGGTYMDILDMM